ncbi:Ku protein [Sulfitobacter sp. D35]|uniref:non-homologous end joining protein Ku n=1 Tax=Sulfitobacter sp. D35 TaxID=3083252 RepID=UPI00296EA8D1|nr:Ku protein [Sulfitobacter sp. D35]MDW4496463.1 Ku protein [Sulfitobacter sp. D35]
MASRPIWKGQLRLSLVSIPVEIHSARDSARRVSFRQIHKPSGKPVRYEKVVQGIGPVDSADIMKGYEVEDGEYVLLEKEEVDAIKLETRKTLELVQFVDVSEIAPIWFDRPYYVVPTDELAEDAYRVLRDALRKSGKAGLGQLTMRGKEHLCAIRPCGDGILLETLYYADEIRSAEPLFSDIEDDASDDELLDVATQLIEKKSAPFDASAYKDNYAKALQDLVKRKVRSGKTPRARADDKAKGDEDNVVDLMDALRKSLKTGKSAKTSAKATSNRSKSGSGSRGKKAS